MESLWQDVRFAFRALRKNLSVTILAVGSLALAIAGNTMVFSLLNGLLYQPLPFAEPHRLSVLSERVKELPGGEINLSSAANFLDWQERQNSFEGMAAVRWLPLSLGHAGDEREQLNAVAVSTNFFSVLGIHPSKGRFFVPEEGVRGTDRVVVLSHRFWAERYASEDPLEGQSLMLNGEPYEVVGVLAEDFDFIDPTLQIYIPLALDRSRLRRHQRDFLVLARLKPEVAHQQAQAEMTALVEQLEAEYPKANGGYTIDVLNLREQLPDPHNQLLLPMMQGALIFVLLIACVNIANLLLALSQAREREIAIRISNGASRRRISRQLLTESMVMALLAGIFGFALASWGIHQLSDIMVHHLPRAFLPVIDLPVLVFNLAVALLGGLLFGILPTLRMRRIDLVAALKDGSQSSTMGGQRRLATNALVVLELVLALVFLAGASVMVESLRMVQNTDPGFSTQNLLIAEFVLPESRYDEEQRLIAGVTELRHRLASLPGVRGSTVSNALPRTPSAPRTTFTLDAQPPAAGQPPPSTIWLTAGQDYFATLGIALSRGRLFSAADSADAPPVVIVNEAMAERYWGGESPLGQRLTILGHSREVVGLVGNARHTLAINNHEAPVVYVPWDQQPMSTVGVTLRTEVEAGSLTQTLRRELLDFDPDAAIAVIGPLEELIEQFWIGQQIITALLRGFGALALVLAALGTYGVLAFSVALRRHEIGVRKAVGARRGQVIAMVLRQGFYLAAIGIVLGIPGVLMVNRLIESVLEGLVPLEVGAVVEAGLVLVAVTLVATFVPAFRAASVDPIVVLRNE